MEFRTKIRELIEGGFDWLAEFTDPLHVHLDQAMGDDGNFDWRWKKEGYFASESRQIEALTVDVGKYLDSLTSLRQSYLNLEEAAVRAAIEYRSIRMDLVFSLRADTDGWEAERLGQKAAAAGEIAGLETEDEQWVPAAARKYFQHETQTLADDQQLVTRRHDAIRARVAASEGKISILEQRHRTAGHALNFGERAKRIRQLMIEDSRALIEKRWLIVSGIAQVFGETPGFLHNLADSDDFIHNHVIWYKQLSRYISHKRGLESECVVPFGIKYPRPWPQGVLLAGLSGTAEDGLAPEVHQTDTGPISASREVVELDTGDLFDWYSNVRLLGVALTYVQKKGNAGSAPLVSDRLFARIRVFPPLQSDDRRGMEVFLSSVPLWQPPPAVFYHVPPEADRRPSDEQFQSGISFRNIFPVGTWRLEVDRFLYGPDNVPRVTSQDNIANVRLHLRVLVQHNIGVVELPTSISAEEHLAKWLDADRQW